MTIKSISKKRLSLYAFFYISFIPIIYAQNWTETYWEHLEIYRDNWGVPHIFATNPQTLGFGFGYTQAQDHWEPMLLSYRLANGKLAEVLGESEENSDRFSIQVGHRYFGTLAYENCDPFTRELCDGFAEGVNSWILENRDKLPEWVDGVQPQDIFALWHAFIVSLAPIDLPTFFKRPPALKSGFAFTISSEKSRENVPLFALSSHQFYQGPFRWYEAHLICGDYNVYGCTLYGLPILLQGHSLKHAWSITPNQADFADVFIEKPESNITGNPKSISNAPNRKDFEALLLLQYLSQSDGYYVKTPNGLEQRFAPVHITQRGPLLLDSRKEFFSWKIGGYEDIGAFFQLWEMGRANSLDKFKQAVYLHQLPAFHVLYMDSSNQSYYFYSAKSGSREIPSGLSEKEVEQIQNVNWTMPVLPKYYPIGWKYLIAPNLLPSIQNPPSGYMQICGGTPTTVTDDIQAIPSDVLVRLIRDTENVVSRRIRSVLRTDKRSLREFQSLLLDDLSSLGVEVIPRLLTIANANTQLLPSLHPDLPTAVQILNNWNLRMEQDATAPVIFYLWSHFFSHQNDCIPSIEIEPYYSLMNKEKEIEEPCLGALADAVRFLKNNRNTIDITWGEIHRIQRGTDEYSIGGSETTGTSLLLSELPPSDQWGTITYGIGFALVARLGPVIESYSIMPFGNSESIQSPHYKDQWNMFSKKQMKKTRFYPEEIYRFAEQGMGRRLVFIPKGGVGEIRCVSSSKITASIQSDMEFPKKLPEGLIPFSLFFTPEYIPKEAYIEFLIKIYIPNDLCIPDELPNLSLYYFNETNGWKLFENQNTNEFEGFLEGTITGRHTFAVLGPKESLANTNQLNQNNKNANANEQIPSGKGIFSPGLPGDIPSGLMEKRKFSFTIKNPQQNDVLPSALNIPPIKKETNEEKETKQSNGKKENMSQPNISNNKEINKGNVEKDKKLKKQKQGKETQNKQIKKNFSTRKK
ncbi:MAG TPA: penicillin acylase family protein [Candidatus Hydrogenedens sp.]|mgnify:CR=1 FL=1|nr:penicillin acylase family protein [Candidatus Hydrogenedens sp.]